MIRKILVSVLALFTAISFAACSQGSQVSGTELSFEDSFSAANEAADTASEETSEFLEKEALEAAEEKARQEAFAVFDDFSEIGILSGAKFRNHISDQSGEFEIDDYITFHDDGTFTHEYTKYDSNENVTETGRYSIKDSVLYYIYDKDYGNADYIWNSEIYDNGYRIMEGPNYYYHRIN